MIKILSVLTLSLGITCLVLIGQLNYRYYQGYVDGSISARVEATQHMKNLLELEIEQIREQTYERTIGRHLRSIELAKEYEAVQLEYRREGIGWSTGISNAGVQGEE